MGSRSPRTAATGALFQTTEIMDPACVVGLAGDELDECRRHIQRQITGRQAIGTTLYEARMLLRTGAGLLTDKTRSIPTNALWAQSALLRRQRTTTPIDPHARHQHHRSRAHQVATGTQGISELHVSTPEVE